MNFKKGEIVYTFDPFLGIPIKVKVVTVHDNHVYHCVDELTGNSLSVVEDLLYKTKEEVIIYEHQRHTKNI